MLASVEDYKQAGEIKIKESYHKPDIIIDVFGKKQIVDYSFFVEKLPRWLRGEKITEEDKIQKM